MLDKSKKFAKKVKDGIKQKKIELEYEQKKRELEEQKLEEKKKKREQELLQKEYDRLLAMDEKQLMVELIYAIRGFYSEQEKLKEQNAILDENINELKERIDSLEFELDSLSSEKQE